MANLQKYSSRNMVCQWFVKVIISDFTHKKLLSETHQTTETLRTLKCDLKLSVSQKVVL